MNRNDAIKALKTIGAELAKEYGYEHISIGEDRLKGAWGEEMVSYLEKTYGECTEETMWYKDDESRKEEHIEFRFRFANPCLSIRKPGEALCEIELSDYVYETKEHDGKFKFSQATVFKAGGIKLLNILTQKLKEKGIEV